MNKFTMNLDQIRLYETQLEMYYPSAVQVSALILKGDDGIKSITEKQLHEAVEYGIARWNKDIEMCNNLTQKRKEEKKLQGEATLRSLETMLKDTLKCHKHLTE